jgi:hypothetical protein
MRKEDYMINIIVGIFLVLHGLVHLLYFGHSMRFFKLKPEMIWPDGSRVFSAFGTEATRNIAANACVLASIGFVAGAAGLFASADWWSPITVISAVFSSALFVLCWDGEFKSLPNKGMYAILINAAILIAVLGFGWPAI